MAKYKIAEVQGKGDLNEFIRFPERLYRSCPQYVPPIRRNERLFLTKDAALEYCEQKLWLVRDSRKVVGRICAVINPRYNEFYGKKCCRFGWFDTIDDIQVARLLIETAEAWAKEKGMDTIHGPMFYNALGKQGMLVEGYENVPPYNCIYNYPYYNDLLERLGFEKECDWVQYKMVANHGVPEKARRLAWALTERYNLHFGSLDAMKKDPEKVRRFFRLYSDSFSASVYNFVPLTDAEIEQTAMMLSPYISDRTSCILEDENGETVAFGIAFPSRSEALQKAKGSLFPFGWYHLQRAKHNYVTADLITNGAVPKWQHKGISAVYYRELGDKALKCGMRWAISNPQIENSGAANIWNSYEREPYMRRRLYTKRIK